LQNPSQDAQTVGTQEASLTPTIVHRHMPSLSVRTKLVLFSLVLIVVPGAVFALLAAGDTTRALEQAVGQQLAAVASDAAQDLADELREIQHEVRGWARQDVMRETIVGDVDKRISRLLLGLRAHNPAYVDLLVGDAEGRTIAAVDPKLLGTEIAGDAWRRALATDDLVTSGPLHSPRTGEQILELATPIHDPEDRSSVSGVLLASYDWSSAGVSFAESRRLLAALGLDVEILVLDERGVLIGGSWKPGAYPIGADLRAAGWRLAAPTDYSYAVEPRVDGLVGRATLAGSGPAWSVLAVQPRAAALSPVQRMNRRFLVTLAVIALGGLLVSALLADRIVRPLRALTRATSALARAEGRLPSIPVRSQDEVGELTGAFNEMAADLSKARDELVAAARLASVAEVAAAIAHEVRTPLGILRGSAQILDRSGDDARRRHELISMIVDETDRIERVVAGLIELGRPGRLSLEIVPLGPLLARAAEFVESEAEAHGIVIIRDFARPCVARCDPDQMYQVALNLLVNALQAQPHGGVIRLRAHPGRHERIVFEVSDEGPGIPPEVRPHIFTPFFTMREGGTGLGLAVVERIVRAHRGTVTVETTTDGTTFRIDLPAAVAA
jgi:signal transduction histidine kinase